MTVTTYAGWVADGKPAKPAQPIADMMATFRRHGYTVYYLPDARHQQANPPEDHDPYSHTPWPGAQPYPYVMALDLMPKDGDARSLTPIARRIIADKRAGRAPWVKYLNWTDEQGKVWHTKWQPAETTSISTDSGHIHISIRTDYVMSTAAAGYDPVGPLQGTAAQGDDDMQQTDKLIRPTGYDARVVGDVDADLENLRNWQYAKAGDALAASEQASALEAAGKPLPTDGSLPGKLVNPPRVGSAAYVTLKAAVAASQTTTLPPAGDLTATLSDDEVQRIAAAFVAALHAAPITVTVQ